MAYQSHTFRYKIAGISFCVTMDPSLEHPYMKDFYDKTGSDPALSINVSYLNEIDNSAKTAGELILNSQPMDVYKTSQGFSLFYKNALNLSHSEFNTDSASADIFLTESFSEQSDDNFILADYVFFAIRDIFFIYCQRKGMIPLHSSSIIYNGKAYLFSAPSGVGKTTHTDMWQSLYHTEILDGDVAMLSVEGSEVYAHGLPWCGTSGKFLNAKYPLGKIIFIKQSDSNFIEDADIFNTVIRIYARSFAPNWSTELAAATVAIAEEIARRNPSALFKCTKTPEAVETVKKYIDSI